MATHVCWADGIDYDCFQFLNHASCWVVFFECWESRVSFASVGPHYCFGGTVCSTHCKLLCLDFNASLDKCSIEDDSGVRWCSWGGGAIRCDPRNCLGCVPTLMSKIYFIHRSFSLDHCQDIPYNPAHVDCCRLCFARNVRIQFNVWKIKKWIR